MTPPLVWRNKAQGKGERQSRMVVASRLNSLDLKRKFMVRSFCRAKTVHFGEQAFKKPTGREGSASANVERATLFKPQWYRRLPVALRQRRLSRYGTPCGKLDESHDGELLLETEFAHRASGFVPMFELLENMSGNQR